MHVDYGWSYKGELVILQVSQNGSRDYLLLGRDNWRKSDVINSNQIPLTLFPGRMRPGLFEEGLGLFSSAEKEDLSNPLTCVNLIDRENAFRRKLAKDLGIKKRRFYKPEPSQISNQ